MGAAAVILRHQSINGTERRPGETLSVEEYEGIRLHVRDAMESSLDIAALSGAKEIMALEERVAALEAKFAALES